MLDKTTTEQTTKYNPPIELPDGTQKMMDKLTTRFNHIWCINTEERDKLQKLIMIKDNKKKLGDINQVLTLFLQKSPKLDISDLSALH